MKGGHAPIQIQRWAPYDYVNDPFVKRLYLERDFRTAAFYPMVLFQSFLEGGDLPSDPRELAAVLLMKPSDVEHSLRVCVDAGKLFVKEGRVFHKRVMQEVVEALEYRERQSAAGKASAGRRWSSRMDGGQGSRTRAENMNAARSKGRHTEEQWQALLDFCGRACLKCGAKESELFGAALTKDHVVMVSKGGSDSIDNLQPLCRNCNTRSASGREDYRQRLPGFRAFIERLTHNQTQAPVERTPNLPLPIPTPPPTPVPNCAVAPVADAPAKIESKRAAEIYQRFYPNGRVPGAMFKELRPLVLKHGWEVVEPELCAYLEQTEIAYQSWPKFAAGFGTWTKGRGSRGPGPQPSEKAEKRMRGLEALVTGRVPHGGNGSGLVSGHGEAGGELPPGRRDGRDQGATGANVPGGVAALPDGPRVDPRRE